MPYIKQTDRAQVARKGATNEGELNYEITVVLRSYWARKGASYAAISDILSALEGAKLEFYRRVAAPYEDKKIKENGDVYR